MMAILYEAYYESTNFCPFNHVLLTLEWSAFANSVDPDQLASEEANWSGSALFVI